MTDTSMLVYDGHMAKRSILNHEHKGATQDGFLCSTCEADGFSERFPTIEARQAHFDATGHGARNLMQQTAEKAVVRSVVETFAGTEEVDRATLERMAPEHRAPGTKISGRQYGNPRPDTKGSAQDCSLKQARFLVSLIKERMGMSEIESIRNALADSWTERGERKFASGEKIVAKKVASTMITKLLAIQPTTTRTTPTTRNTPTPVAEPANAAPASSEGTIKRITNKYPKSACDQCGARVEVGEGWWEISDDGEKTVVHKECPQSIGIPNGRYAVEHEGTLKFYHVTPGGLFVMASDDEHKIKSQTYIDAFVELIKADPFEAMRRYGAEIKKCSRCHRSLTLEQSRERGMGDICYGKARGEW